MTLNGHFALNSVLGPYVWSSEACFRSLATLKLVSDRMLSANVKTNRTAAALRGFLATVRLSSTRQRSLIDNAHSITKESIGYS